MLSTVRYLSVFSAITVVIVVVNANPFFKHGLKNVTWCMRIGALKVVLMTTNKYESLRF